MEDLSGMPVIQESLRCAAQAAQEGTETDFE